MGCICSTVKMNSAFKGDSLRRHSVMISSIMFLVHVHSTAVSLCVMHWTSAYLVLSWKPPNTSSCLLLKIIRCPLRPDGPPGALSEHTVRNYFWTLLKPVKWLMCIQRGQKSTTSPRHVFKVNYSADLVIRLMLTSCYHHFKILRLPLCLFLGPRTHT